MSREEDARVAEILGYTFWEERRSGYDVHVVYRPENAPDKKERRPHAAEIGLRLSSRDFKITNCINSDILPYFTSDPSADYNVLEWMRDKYRDGDTASEWMVWERYFQEVPGDICDYHPGDYSRALLELDRKGLLDSTSSSE